MKKLIIPALMAFLSFASFAGQADAQSSLRSAENRDALIGQLENVLEQLQNERSMANAAATQSSASNKVVEGSLSANNLMASTGSYSGLGSSVGYGAGNYATGSYGCLLYTSPSPRDQRGSRMPSSA